MSPVQFPRVSTGEESIFHENKLFSTFDLGDEGIISFEIFRKGLIGLRFGNISLISFFFMLINFLTSQDEVLEVQLAKGIKEFVEHAMITL